MSGFMSGLAGGLGQGASMGMARRGADPSELQRQGRMKQLMGKLGQSNTLKSSAKPLMTTAQTGAKQAYELQKQRAAAAAGGNETKSAMFAEGGMVGRSYAKS